MRLYVLRHATAVEHGAAGLADEDRPLTDEGAKRMKAAAKGMAALGLKFDRLLSSPWLRARQTAEIVGGVSSKQVEFWESLKGDANPRQTVAALARISDDRVLIVGHQPHLGALVSLLIAGDESVQLELKKGGLCKLSMEAIRAGRSATLDWLLTPAFLRRQGRR